MSIGIVSLTTLFPLSVLRSLKASQLTKGTDLRYNAESLLTLFPTMITDPDADGTANTQFPDFYVVDPYGWNAVNSSPTPAVAASFGNDGNGTPYPSNFVAGINKGGVGRFNLRRNTFSFSDGLVMLPDSWVQQVEAPAGALATRAGASGPTEITVTGSGGVIFALTPGVTSRAVIFGADGVSMHVRTLTATPGSNRLLWTEDTDGSGALNGTEDINGNSVLDDYSLPVGFVPATVRIDSQERRYTWLLTCRKTTSFASADVDVVVFFGRSIENPNEDELLYPASIVASQASVTVDYGDPNLPASARNVLPPAKKGSFLFDANNARWYRITSLTDDPANKQLKVGIEIPAYAGSPNTGGRVMFAKRVVDFYPLGVKP